MSLAKVAFGNCKKCNEPLQSVGTSRANGADHDDWCTRTLHKKCWKELTPAGMHAVRIIEKFPAYMGNVSKKQPTIVHVPDDVVELFCAIANPRLLVRQLRQRIFAAYFELKDLEGKCSPEELNAKLQAYSLLLAQELSAREIDDSDARSKLKKVSSRFTDEVIDGFITNCCIVCERGHHLEIMIHVYYSYAFARFDQLTQFDHVNKYDHVHRSQKFQETYINEQQEQKRKRKVMGIPSEREREAMVADLMTTHHLH